MKPDVLISEARARIIWGEPSSSVRYFLTSNGMSDADADAKIKEFNVQRNTEIRKIGIKKTVISAALVIGAGVYFYFGLKARDFAMSSNSVKGALRWLRLEVFMASGSSWMELFILSARNPKRNP